MSVAVPFGGKARNFPDVFKLGAWFSLTRRSGLYIADNIFGLLVLRMLSRNSYSVLVRKNILRNVGLVHKANSSGLR